jgi:hypothetical protein
MCKIKFPLLKMWIEAMMKLIQSPDWYILGIRLKMDPIPGIGTDWSLIQSQFIGQLGLGGAIQYQYPVLGPFLIQLVTLWMIPKGEAHGLQPLGVGLRLKCDTDSIPIPQDWIARVIQSLIFWYLVSKNWSNPINWPIPYQIGLVSPLLEAKRTSMGFSCFVLLFSHYSKKNSSF